MKKVIICIFLTNSVLFLYSQKRTLPFNPGIGVVYNFQTSGIGPELRADFNLSKHFKITPRLSYFLPSNKIHEYFIGCDASYNLELFQMFNVYTFLGGYYNRWMNYEKFSTTKARLNNLVPEAGIGIEYMPVWYLIPYVEWRYNGKWREGSLVVGVKLCLNNVKPKYKIIDCPDFNN